MSGGGNEKKSTQAEEAAQSGIKYRTMDPFMGNAQNMIAQQLAAGGYGNENALMGILGNAHQPMQMGYVTDAQGSPQYSGSLLMQALRKQLDAQGIKADAGSKK